MSSLAQPSVAPASLAGAAFDQLLKPPATSPIGAPPLDPDQADLGPVSRPAPTVLSSRHVPRCSFIDGEGGVAASLDAVPTASAPQAAVAGDGLVVAASLDAVSTASAPQAAVAGDGLIVPPVRPGRGDWRGCFDRVVASTVPVAPCKNVLGGWQLVSRERRSAPAAFHCLAVNVRRPPPVWLRDRCFRCLCRGHREYPCRDPIRCTDCLRSGHIARFCRAKKHVLQASPLQCPTPSPASSSDISKTNVQFQSISTEKVGLVEETELLRTEPYDFLARVWSVLGRAKAALAKLEVVSDVSSLPELQIGLVP
ncbi:uncharacterized protein LOC119340913 [Triticum dicoccoides]|uniref:uncharacterized protein LOC119340913 n=1 Tax=Triticum dicoccoides TaxID=85692 RepID=UPI001890E899|nr:uncharacterized protein LOC119340913 [Triticum dicoccoides]